MQLDAISTQYVAESINENITYDKGNQMQQNEKG